MTEPRKAAHVDLDKDFPEDDDKDTSENKSEYRKTNYTNLSEPGKYIIRLVAKPIKCRKRWKPFRATYQDDEIGLDPAVKNGWRPADKKFAGNIINKTNASDGSPGVLEVLEKGPSVFKHFANYYSVFGKKPWGKEGPDFQIKVKIPKDSNGEYIRLKTEYSVTHLETAPFTEEEVKMIKDSGNLYPLEDMYKSTTAEKMNDLWNGLSDAQKEAPASQQRGGRSDDAKAPAPAPAPSKPIEEPMQNTPADDDDLFGDSSEKATGASEPGEIF